MRTGKHYTASFSNLLPSDTPFFGSILDSFLKLTKSLEFLSGCVLGDEVSVLKEPVLQQLSAVHQLDNLECTDKEHNDHEHARTGSGA